MIELYLMRTSTDRSSVESVPDLVAASAAVRAARRTFCRPASFAVWLRKRTAPVSPKLPAGEELREDSRREKKHLAVEVLALDREVQRADG